MHYLLLIYDEEKIWTEMPQEQSDELIGEFLQFTHDMRDRNKLIGGDALQPTHTATTVRVRDGKTTITDGPFAETREQLGGYYVLEAENLDEAVKLAARIPSARFGSIEIRPIQKYE